MCKASSSQKLPNVVTTGRIWMSLGGDLNVGHISCPGNAQGGWESISTGKAKALAVFNVVTRMICFDRRGVGGHVD